MSEIELKVRDFPDRIGPLSRHFAEKVHDVFSTIVYSLDPEITDSKYLPLRSIRFSIKAGTSHRYGVFVDDVLFDEANSIEIVIVNLQRALDKEYIRAGISSISPSEIRAEEIQLFENPRHTEPDEPMPRQAEDLAPFQNPRHNEPEPPKREQPPDLQPFQRPRQNTLEVPGNRQAPDLKTFQRPRQNTLEVPGGERSADLEAFENPRK